jgi:hypothetical protein
MKKESTHTSESSGATMIRFLERRGEEELIKQKVKGVGNNTWDDSRRAF